MKIEPSQASDLLLNNSLNYVIKGFPYPTRFCPYCEEPTKVLRALHIQGEEEHYKAVMICDNPNCGAYDEEAKEAYVRVYYSTPYAHHMLETLLGQDPRTNNPNLRKS